MHELYPEIYNSIQTRHAVQTIIHYEARDIEELFKRGLLEESEYVKMSKSLMKTEHRLYFSSFYYVSSVSSSDQDKKQTLLSVIFINKLQKHTATYQDKINYLFKQIANEGHIYNKNDIIIKRGEKPSPSGIYILVSGIASGILHKHESFMMSDILENKEMMEEKEIFNNKVDTKRERENRNTLSFTKGQIIGGWGYLTDKPYITTCIATTACDVYFIPDQVIKYLLKDEKEAFIHLWRQIAVYVMLTQFWRNNTANFAFYGKTAINLMCQQSTFKQFTSKNQNKRSLLLNEYKALLLDGDAYYDVIDDPLKQSRFSRKIFKSPCILLPYHKGYKITYNGKVIIFDHDPNLQKKASILSPRRSVRYNARQNLRR